MKKLLRGISIVEVLIAIAVFSVIASAATQSYLISNKLSILAADKTKAVWLAEEGIEATRSIRDSNYSKLTTGTYGVMNSTGIWNFSSTSDYTDVYNRSVSITVLGADNAYATSTVSWNTTGATSTVSIGTHLTNWHKLPNTQSAHTKVGFANAYIPQLMITTLTGISLSTDGVIATTTITQIIVSWTPTKPITDKLSIINSPNSTIVFGPGVASNGSTNTLTKPIVLGGVASSSLQFTFNNSMSGKSFTLLFTFVDGSTQLVSIPNPPVK